MMAILIAISVGLVFGSSRELRKALTTRGAVDVEMFLFGVGFLLIETKFVTAMKLAWGATWITSAVVFGAILVTILASTLPADRSSSLRCASRTASAYGLRPTSPSGGICSAQCLEACSSSFPCRWDFRR